MKRKPLNLMTLISIPTWQRKRVYLYAKKMQNVPKHIIPGEHFRCTITKRQYNIKHHLDYNVTKAKCLSKIVR